MDRQALADIIKNNGIVGAGGAGFPTYAKLSEGIHTIILNCAECEPLLKLHRQLLELHAPEILAAFSTVKESLGADKAIIGIKEEYRTTIQALEACLGDFPGISIHPLPGAYPMGDEVVLIYEATGAVVPPGGIPAQRGIAVFNVETMYNVHRALKSNHPVIEKLVSIVGEVGTPCTLNLPLGMRVSEAVELAGGATTDEPVYLMGGPMMGYIGSGDTLITKTTNAIIVLPARHPYILKKNIDFNVAVGRAASVCCQCRTCTDLCPRHNLGHPISPHLFMRSAANRDMQNLDPFLDTFFCSGCGVCETYACPQGLRPRTMIGQYKAGLRQEGIKPPKRDGARVSEQREYRRVPEERLLSRLGLAAYDSEAPMDESRSASPRRVCIPLSQHIGAPAQAVVKTGQKIKKGDLIAKPAEGLSCSIHASINGKIVQVSPKEIVIEAEVRR